jgi:hypothetical protein
MKRLFSSTAVAFVIAIFFAATTSCAQDNIASRQAAADRYFKVAPMSKMLDDMLTEMAKKIPEDRRDKFVSQMKEAIRVDVVERIARESMVKTFTTDEMIVLADFFGSQHSASAMKKFGTYMEETILALMQEIQRAIQQLKAQQNKKSNQ